MRIHVQPFTQEVSTAGYEVQEATAGFGSSGLTIVPRQREDYRKTIRYLTIDLPLSVISRIISVRQDNKDDVEAFCNKYGLLKKDGEYKRLFLEERSTPSLGGMDSYPSDSHSFRKYYDGPDIVIRRAVKEGNYRDLFKDLRESFSKCMTDRYDIESNKLILEYQPDSLYLYLCAFLCKAYMDGKLPKACENCGDYFLPKDARSAHGRFCGGACRVASHRFNS